MIIRNGVTVFAPVPKQSIYASMSVGDCYGLVEDNSGLLPQESRGAVVLRQLKTQECNMSSVGEHGNVSDDSIISYLT